MLWPKLLLLFAALCSSPHCNSAQTIADQLNDLSEKIDKFEKELKEKFAEGEKNLADTLDELTESVAESEQEMTSEVAEHLNTLSQFKVKQQQMDVNMTGLPTKNEEIFLKAIQLIAKTSGLDTPQVGSHVFTRLDNAWSYAFNVPRGRECATQDNCQYRSRSTQVTFEVAFSNPPHVVLSVIELFVTPLALFNVEAQSVTTTGFRLYTKQPKSFNLYNFRVDWYAFPKDPAFD